MNSMFKKSFCLSFAFFLVLLSAFPAFAADGDALKVNEAFEVKKGDTIKFTLNLSETREEIIGFEMRLFYNSDKLEFVKDSFHSEKFDNVFYNENIPGMIPMNWTNISEPADFSKKAEFFSCEFSVLDGGEAEISYFVTEMYGDDMTYLKSYKWTYDVSSDGEQLVSDGILPVSTDEDTLNNHQSSFINYIDGMGEENSPNKDSAHDSVLGEKGATYNVYEEDVIDVTRYVSSDSGEGGGLSPVTVAIVIIIPAIIALIVIAVVISVRGKNKNNQE